MNNQGQPNKGRNPQEEVFHAVAMEAVAAAQVRVPECHNVKFGQ